MGASWTYQEGAPFVANKRTLGTIRTEKRALYIRSKKKKNRGGKGKLKRKCACYIPDEVTLISQPWHHGHFGSYNSLLWGAVLYWTSYAG